MGKGGQGPMTAPVKFNDDKERVRDASDIVRVIGEHIALKAKGREYAGLCPFHDDHKPSMMVSPAKQLFKCFVCGAGGDIFGFVQKYHKMDFREALEYLAERAGIELTKWSGRGGTFAEAPTSGGPEVGGTISRADLVRANQTAAEFFRLVLKREDLGRVGREIIERRGISPEMVEAFGIGLSPERWDGLLLTIQGKSLDPRAFLEAGLLKERDSGGFYDAFRNRLMFPIQDQIGRVIAFGGRKIKEEDEPKYLNSAETRVFEKSGTLYGLFQASRSIQAERTAIITEGYTDTIACHQAGITNAVATLGTALTARHAAILRRLCETVVLLFDGDDAGQRAADRAVEVFFAEDLDVKIATLAGVTDGGGAKDPDELLKREGGAEVLRAAIAKATHLLEYRYARIKEKLAGAGMAALSRAIEDELKRLVDLGLNDLPLLRRKLIIKRIAAIAGVDEETIWRSIPGGRRTPSAPQTPAGSRTSGVGQLTTQQQALACVLCEPTLWLTISDADKEVLDPAHLPAGPGRVVAEAVFDLAASGHGCGVSAVIALLDDPDSQSVATEMHARMMDITGGDSDRVKMYFRDCLRALALEEPPHSSDSPLIPPSLDSIRRRHAAMGGNRRVLPRPRPV